MDLLFSGTVSFSDGIFLATDDSNRVIIFRICPLSVTSGVAN